MLLDELKDIVKMNGIVGAGGAGFPSYAKMTDKADTVILNCAECEPLLQLHKQLLAAHAEEIVRMLDEVREAMGAKEAVIGIKREHVNTVRILNEVIKDHSAVRICGLDAAYPVGDEVVLIYEATGRVIKPGGIPIDEGVVVYNAETMYNIYRAVYMKQPVTDKLISVVGEIDHPATIRVPLGITVKDAVALAGKITTADPAYIMGGPMMGRQGSADTIITKTTNAIIILPEDHPVVRRMNKNISTEIKRASSACCQCRTCTDLCPRHALGHPIEPHRVMRAAANHDTSDVSVFINSLYCSSCGLCENYSCPQGLSPRSIIAQFKGGLRKAGIKPAKIEPAAVVSDRQYRKVPVKRLKSRLDLAEYDVKIPFDDAVKPADHARILMSQHIGAPAVPCVKAGDTVNAGQKIADAAQGLSVAIHSSIDGKVLQVSEREIVIDRK